MKASLTSLHHQDTDWMRELSFYKEEIAILAKRLEEVMTKNTDKEIASQVEHFQNKFILQRERIDTLNHKIGERETGIQGIAKDKPEHINEKFTTVKDTVHADMKDFTKGFADTRFEFNQFLAKYL